MSKEQSEDSGIEVDVSHLQAESIPSPEEVDYELHDNVCVDLTRYVRSNTIQNEEQFNLVTLAYLTGYMRDIDHYVAGVITGTSSSGKTHVQGKIEDLFADAELYSVTNGTDKSLVYDGEWDKARIASLDELQKPSQELIEFLKAVHGDDEKFTYKVTGGDASKGAERGTETIVRTAKPYWFLYAQQGADDFEMWNRLLKIPVYESESKNRAVGAYKHGHDHISIGEEDGAEYIESFENGTDALQAHFADIAERWTEVDSEGKKNGSAYVNLPTTEELDVWDVLEPIYNHSRSEVNRVYGMISGLVRASALLNYKNREITTEYIDGHGEIEVIQATGQDVANVLRMRESLLASTHELDRKKKAILSGIKHKGGASMECTLSDIQEYLKESDAPLVKRSELEAIMEDLRDNYMLDIHPDAAADGKSDIYEFFGWDELRQPRVEDYADEFQNTKEPIGNTNFLDWFREHKNDLQTTADDYLKHAGTEVSSSPSTDSGESDAQQTLGGGGSSGESLGLEPHEELILRNVHDTLDGEVREDLSKMSVKEMLGIEDGNVGGTVLDPENEVWYQPHRAPNWVEDEADSSKEVRQVIGRFIEKGIIAARNEMEKGEVISSEIHVLSPEQA